MNTENRNDVQRPRQRKYRDVSPNKAHVTITNIEDRRKKSEKKSDVKQDRFIAQMKSANSGQSSPSHENQIQTQKWSQNSKYLVPNYSPQHENDEGISQNTRLRISLSDGRLSDSKPQVKRKLKEENIANKAISTVTVERRLFSRDQREKHSDRQMIDTEENSPSHTVAIQTEQLIRPGDHVESLERSPREGSNVKHKHRSPRIANSQRHIDSKSVCHLKPDEVRHNI